MTLEEIEKRLRINEDIEEIKKLHYRYINCLTLSQYDGILECFSENPVVDLGEGSQEGVVSTGREEIAQRFKQILSGAHIGREGNFIVHPIIDVDGDEATGTWLSYFLHVKDHGDPLHWMQGIYDCKYK